VVEVDFLAGNGFISEDLDYLVSLVDKVQDIPPTVWGSITGDIEDQTDLIDYISSQVTTPTLQSVTDEGNSTTNAIQVGGITSGNFISDGSYIFGVSDDLDGIYNFQYIPNVGLYIGDGADYYVALSKSGNIQFSTPNGFASLNSTLLTGIRNLELPDADGTIALTSDIPTLTSQLTNDVPFLTQDNVVEYPDLASFPVTGVIGTIYIALDTGFFYSWNGSAYVLSSPTVTGITGVGTTNYLSKFTSPTTIGNSNILNSGQYIFLNYTGRPILSGNTFVSIQRNQSQIDFILGNPGFSQPSFIVSDNQTDGFEIQSKGEFAIKTGATYANEGLRVFSTGKLKFTQTPDTGTTSDFILLRDTSGNIKQIAYPTIPTTPTLQEVTDAGDTITGALNITQLSENGLLVTNAIVPTELAQIDSGSLFINGNNKQTSYTANTIIYQDEATTKALGINYPTSIVGTNKIQTFQDADGVIALTSDITTPTLQEVLIEGDRPIKEINTNYSFEDADRGKYLLITDTADLTLNADILASDSELLIKNSGGGIVDVNLVVGTGVTVYLNNTDGSAGAVFPIQQGNIFILKQNGNTNFWYLSIISSSLDSTTPTLQEVANVGNTLTDTNILFNSDFSNSEISINVDDGILLNNIDSDKMASIEQSALSISNYDGTNTTLLLEEGFSHTTSGITQKLTFENITSEEEIIIPNASGTIALLSDIPSGGVTSVGLTMPSAFTVTNSPITSSGDIAVTGAGLVSQYVRGDGTLANFPNSTGGGSSVNYYLNGSVSQGTFGGTTYYQMSKTPIIGAGTNFTRTNGAGNGYIASFITDAGDPSQLNIPGGNWNVEFYFQSSSPGGTPSFYAELYKVSATNVFTLIASDSLNPEGITNGTTVDQYFTSIPVPQTSLLVTDRLAVRIFVNTGGRTITLHTENGNLSEVLTTFTTGLTALNGLTDQVQFFDVGTGATNFNISSSGDTHTFNLLFNIRRNANNSSNNNINYNGYAVTGSAESSAVWTITRLTIAASGSITVATATNVAWTDRETTIYT
jgi:hypothetical protein